MRDDGFDCDEGCDIPFSALVGKTIESVDDSCINCKIVTFSDGTRATFEADTVEGSIPRIRAFYTTHENDNG